MKKLVVIIMGIILTLPQQALCLRPLAMKHRALLGKELFQRGNANYNVVDTQAYQWGTGNFRDIADIRRRVYTCYYTLTEHFDMMQEVLGRETEEHCRKLLAEIENPLFYIDSQNYEQIKAYLWQRAREEFPDEIRKWEEEKDKKVARQSEKLLEQTDTFLNSLDISTKEGWRRASVMSIALDLFDILEEEDPKQIFEEVTDMLSQEGAPAGVNVPIDFSDLFFDRVVRNRGRVAFLTGDINTLAADMKLYGERLLSHWLSKIMEELKTDNFEDAIAKAKEQGISITFIANKTFQPRNNNKIVQRNTTVADIERLLSLDGFASLRRFADEGIFKIVSFSSDFSGTVLTDLTDECRKAILDSGLVIAKGQQNGITTDGLKKDCFRLFPISDFANIFYTGIKFNKDDFKYPQFCILYAPAEVLPAVSYFPDLPSKLTAYQFYRIYQLLAFKKWDTIMRLLPSSPFVNVIDYALSSQVLTETEKAALREIRGMAFTEKREIAEKVMAEFGGNYSYISRQADNFKTATMHIIHFPEGTRSAKGDALELGVLFANELQSYSGGPKSKVTFNDLARNIKEVNFSFTFLYFITRNIIERFNKTSPHFLLGDRFFGEYIDFLKTEISGREVLYPPLYNKGAIGMRRNGTFVFGRIQIPKKGTIRIPIGNQEVTFSWTKVNPIGDFGDEISIFTPAEDKFKDRKFQADHSFGQTRSMYFMPDNNNYNFVVVNDKLLGVVVGKTEIPPFGTALSVPGHFLTLEQKEILDKEIRQLKKSKITVDDPKRVKFQFQLDDKWSNCVWIVGGALLMVDDSKVENLYYDPINSTDSVYHLEGWALESSQRTQETPVEENLNEARTTIGLTQDGQFFILIIEGRANNRTGATHEETVKWLQEYFGERGTGIRYALDLDSASSVAIGVIDNGEFHLLSQTARGSDSKLGDIRYYNHVAFLRRINEAVMSEANRAIEILPESTPVGEKDLRGLHHRILALSTAA